MTRPTPRATGAAPPPSAARPGGARTWSRRSRFRRTRASARTTRGSFVHFGGPNVARSGSELGLAVVVVDVRVSTTRHQRRLVETWPHANLVAVGIDGNRGLMSA